MGGGEATLELYNGLDKNQKSGFHSSQLHNGMNSPRRQMKWAFLENKRKISVRSRRIRAETCALAFSVTCRNGWFPAAASSPNSHIQIFMSCVRMHSLDITCSGLTDRRHNLVLVKSEPGPPRPTSCLLTFLAAASGIAPFSARQEIYTVMGIYSERKEGGKLVLEIRVASKAK